MWKKSLNVDRSVRIHQWEFYRQYIRPKIKWWHDLRKERNDIPHRWSGRK